MPASAEPASRRDWQEIFALLDTALDLDSDQRAAWLEALPAEHARLSPMLSTLLQAHASMDIGDFMRAPATFALPTETTRQGLTVQSLVGPYRLLREIGQGGMASVWLADRPDGLLERQVALKLPHVSWGVASFAERMTRERKILASLTTNPAQYFKAAKKGRVEKGFDADVVVLDGDPTADVTNLAKVAYTIRAGKVIYQKP